jgi:hypothetical protein
MPIAEKLGDPHRMHNADDANVSLLALLGLHTTAADGAEREARITGETAGVGINGELASIATNRIGDMTEGYFCYTRLRRGLEIGAEDDNRAWITKDLVRSWSSTS